MAGPYGSLTALRNLVDRDRRLKATRVHPGRRWRKKDIHAFLSAEDKRFYEHGGLDLTGIVRAGMKYLETKMSGHGGIQGASTITQQVAKNFLLTSDRTFDRKIKEAILSIRIESAYSKDKILELYLNEIYLGASP